MSNVGSVGRYSKYAIQVIRNEGSKSFKIRSLKKLAKEISKMASRLEGDTVGPKIAFSSIVDRRDVMMACVGAQSPAKYKKGITRTINWVISPPRGGGGHMNMFRFIEHLDKLGYKNNIYLYTTHDFISPQEAADNVSHYAKLKNATFIRYNRDKKLAAADAIFATGWETAYPVLNAGSTAKKFYFVQDFEPLFYPVGTEYVLAENTYRFGFHGITAGRWLAAKLEKDYGMHCDSYDFSAEAGIYSYQNTKKRKEVFFYARPVTERRAFDLGIMALELFHEKHPEYTINLAGWDVSGYEIGFPYVDHKALPLHELSNLYNRCATGLVLSLTNMSLLPLELLACGVIPVVNDGENNRLVTNNPFIAYAGSTPRELADAMSAVVSRKTSNRYAKEAANSIDTAGWDGAKDIFIETLERELYV